MYELLERIKEEEFKLPGTTVWYRGHSDSNYKLKPTYLRLSKPPMEADLFYDYKNFSFGIDSCTSDWQILLNMQHYGVPTRLLDWTWNMGAALYFATAGNPISPTLWIMAPHELNLRSIGKEWILDTSSISDTEEGEYEKFSVYDLITKNTTVENPFAIEPAHSNRRISAQRGTFTVHGYGKKAIEEVFPDIVRKIEIPISEVGSIKKLLSSLGIDAFSVFPDNEGLAKYLKERYGY
jgi:hypothetical protein